MIIHPAAYALLILSSQSSILVYGESPTVIKGQRTKGNVPSNIPSTSYHRQLKKGSDISQDDGAATAGDVEVNADLAIPEPPCNSIGENKDCEEDDGCTWFEKQCIEKKCGSFTDQKPCEESEILGKDICLWEDDECIDTTPTSWPTYNPTLFKTRSPTYEIETPTIVTLENGCDPIGSRLNLSIPRNNPVMSSPTPPVSISPSASPLPKIELDLPEDENELESEDNPANEDKPVESPTNDAVTFRRGDLTKDISRFGIKGM